MTITTKVHAESQVVALLQTRDGFEREMLVPRQWVTTCLRVPMAGDPIDICVTTDKHLPDVFSPDSLLRVADFRWTGKKDGHGRYLMEPV